MTTLSLVLLGAITFVKDTALFVTLSFMGQLVGGIGAGINSTCSFAIISLVYPKQKEIYIGFLEAGTGCGLLVGPLLGGGLYHFGGYSVPYLALASVFLLILPFVVKIGRINFERQT
jgi:DHA1 family tetracycline resistance protein-like MFS transporter